jgi:hypothetical protein
MLKKNWAFYLERRYNLCYFNLELKVILKIGKYIVKKILPLQFYLKILAAFLLVFFLQTAFADNHELEEYKVQFDYEGHSEERKILYDFFIKENTCTSYPLQKEEIGIDLYDIDDDGKMEILVYLENRGQCGSIGCSFFIFKQIDKNQHQYILWGANKSDSLIVEDLIKILKNKTLGVHDILFAVRQKYALWQWQGDQYNFIKNIDPLTSK